jgi:hypothetical protein
MGGAVPRRLVSTHIFQGSQSRNTDPDGLGVLRTVIERRYPGWRKALVRADSARPTGDQFGRRPARVLSPDPSVPAGGARRRATAAGSALPSGNPRTPRAARCCRFPVSIWRGCSALPGPTTTCLEKDADLPTLAHFLDNRLVLNYRNGSDWYDVHPLLRELVDAHDVRSGFLTRRPSASPSICCATSSGRTQGFSLIFLFADCRPITADSPTGSTSGWRMQGQALAAPRSQRQLRAPAPRWRSMNSIGRALRNCLTQAGGVWYAASATSLAMSSGIVPARCFSRVSTNAASCSNAT